MRFWYRFSLIAKNLHGLLCYLPGAFAEGWHGSLRGLIRLYRKKAGKVLSGKQAQDAVAELIAAGFLKTRPGRRQLTYFQIVEPPVEGGQNTNDAPSRKGETEPPAPSAHEPEQVGLPLDGSCWNAEKEVLPAPAPALAESSPPAEAPAPAAEPAPEEVRGNRSHQCEGITHTSLSSVEDSMERTTTASSATEPEPPAPSTPPAPRPEAAAAAEPFQEKEAIIRQVRERFDYQIGARTIRKLIESTSAQNVRNQLDWFSYRDVSRFVRGPVAAFHTLCLDEIGEPPVLADQRRAEEHRKAAEEKQQAQDAREAQSERRFRQAFEELDAAELEQIKAKVKASLGMLFTNEESERFQGLLRGHVLEAARAAA